MLFSNLCDSIIDLSIPQTLKIFDILSDKLNLYENKDNISINDCSKHNKCIHCCSINIVKNGKMKNGNQKYFCKDCRKSFCNSTNTIYYSTKKKYKDWNNFCKCMNNCLTLEKSASKCDISIRTAFLWRHKIMNILGKDQKSEILNENVEIDETYIPDNYKGPNKDLYRKPMKRGGSLFRGLSNEQVCFLAAIDANDKLFASKVGNGNPTSHDLNRIINIKIDNNCRVISDCKSAYESIFRNKNCELIQLKAGVYIFDKYHLANINSLHGELKTFLRIFHGVASKYLKGYLDWFCYRKFIKYKIDLKYHQIKLMNRIIESDIKIIRESLPVS